MPAIKPGIRTARNFDLNGLVVHQVYGKCWPMPLPAKQADSEEQRLRPIQRLGFPHEITRFTDPLNNHFALWSRLQPADSQDASPAPRLNIRPPENR